MTHRDKTARFKELRRLYQPHSIKIKDISNIIRSAAHRAEAKFNTFRGKDPYHHSDDSEEGISLLKTTKSKHSDSEDSTSSSDDSDDNDGGERRKLPIYLSKALEHTPFWLELLGRIDENVAMIQLQC